MRLVIQATSGGDMQTTPAPKLISSPTVAIVTPRPKESSANIPVGRSMLRPTTKLPSAKATMENCLRNTRDIPTERSCNGTDSTGESWPTTARAIAVSSNRPQSKARSYR